MAISRSAYKRYKVIDSLLRNTFRPYPTLMDIQEACINKLDLAPSLDTLEKDIRNMKESDGLDAPIIYCRKNKGYYYSNPNYSINSIPLTDDDIDDIKVALEILQNINNGSRVNEKFGYAIEKILASYKEEFPESNTKRKIIQTDYVENPKGFENFDLLFKACKNQYPVSFSHYSYSKREFKVLIVHPVLLKEFENRWYLVGYSEKHNSIRTFGLDRIYEAILLKRKFIQSDEKKINSYFKDIYGVYPIDNQVKQEIKFMTYPKITNYFEAYPIHSSQIANKQSNGSCYFTLNLIPSVELIRLFRAYANGLEIIEPDWLNDEILNF